MSGLKCESCKNYVIMEIEGEPNPTCKKYPECNYIETTMEDLGFRYDNGSFYEVDKMSD